MKCICRAIYYRNPFPPLPKIRVISFEINQNNAIHFEDRKKYSNELIGSVKCALFMGKNAIRMILITDSVFDMNMVWYIHVHYNLISTHIVYPKKYAHCFVVLCFVVVMQSFVMNSHEVFIHIHQCCFAGTGAIVTLPQCQ